jgi:preprotein translocase subunit SecB
MELMEAKFSFESLRLLESHFKFSTDFKPKRKQPIEISTEISISHKEQNRTVKVTISVISVNKKQPFILDTTVMGTFNFLKIPSKKDLDKIVHVNCAAIMFPYVREIIADLTRRADIPSFHMDPINFVALYEDHQAYLRNKRKTKT